MKRLFLAWALLTAGCAAVTLPAPVPVPPRPASTPFRVGITFSPFTPDEWQHFGAWTPLWRVQIDQAADVEAHGAHPLLVGVCESDAATDALMPFLPQAAAFEPGNECNFGEDPTSVGVWLSATVAKVMATGFPAERIITPGIGNIDPDTLDWLQTMLAAAHLPPGVRVGWHAYSNWRGQIPALLGVLHGRPHAMTETGVDATTGTESAIAAQAVSDLNLIYQSGSQTAIWFQLHDDPNPTVKDASFGLHARDGHWRAVETSLVGAIR